MKHPKLSTKAFIYKFSSSVNNTKWKKLILTWGEGMDPKSISHFCPVSAFTPQYEQNDVVFVL